MSFELYSILCAMHFSSSFSCSQSLICRLYCLTAPLAVTNSLLFEYEHNGWWIFFPRKMLLSKIQSARCQSHTIYLLSIQENESQMTQENEYVSISNRKGRIRNKDRKRNRCVKLLYTIICMPGENGVNVVDGTMST